MKLGGYLVLSCGDRATGSKASTGSFRLPPQELPGKRAYIREQRKEYKNKVV
jgi:hypothetical protein